MKIVLFALNASFSHRNLAVRCLRQALEERAFEVLLIEKNLHDRTLHILEELCAADADVYGFSCYIWNLNEMLTLAKAVHDVLPRARILLGGPEVSFGTERFDAMDWIDAIVCGEGEEATCELCRAIATGEEHPRILHGKERSMEGSGVFYREGEEGGGILYYESSRGCPFRCAYCLSSKTRGVQFRSVAQTLADMEQFEKTDTDCRIIKFVDRTFNADPKRANAIWEALLSEGFTKRYHFEICATLLDEESFSILSRFPKGKVQLEIGLQSTNPQTLAASSRHVDAQTVIRASERIHRMGNVHVHLDLIAGLPFEDYESFGRSFDAAYGKCDLLQLGFLKLLHGTELRDRMEEYGYQCLAVPPYTVLCSRWISYPEMQRLSHVAEVLDRYLESGRFSHALWYLTPLMPSPFRFWEALAQFLSQRDPRPLQRISQPDAFRYFNEYAREAVPGASAALLSEMLCADFTQHEHKNPPAFLRADLKKI